MTGYQSHYTIVSDNGHPKPKNSPGKEFDELVVFQEVQQAIPVFVLFVEN